METFHATVAFLTGLVVGSFLNVVIWRLPRGESLIVRFDEPTSISSLNLLQPINQARNRFITKVDLVFDDDDTLQVELDDSSREPPGQLLEFPERTVEKLEIEIVQGNASRKVTPWVL